MNKLIVCRHGQYDITTGHLNDEGRECINLLAERLPLFVDGGSVLLLTSPIFCARESAEIIGSKLGVEVRTEDTLCEYYSTIDKVVELVKEHGDADVLLLVTHGSFASSLPRYFVPMPTPNLRKGEAWLIDFERRHATHFQNRR